MKLSVKVSAMSNSKGQAIKTIPYERLCDYVRCQFLSECLQNFTAFCCLYHVHFCIGQSYQVKMLIGCHLKAMALLPSVPLPFFLSRIRYCNGIRQFWTLRRALIPDSGSQIRLLYHLGRFPFLFRLGGCTIDCSCQARVLCTYAHCLWAVWSLKRHCFGIVWQNLPANKPLKVSSD